MNRKYISEINTHSMKYEKNHQKYIITQKIQIFEKNTWTFGKNPHSHFAKKYIITNKIHKNAKIGKNARAFAKTH